MKEKFYYLVLGGGDLKYITVNTDGTEHIVLLHFNACKSTKRNERKIKRNRNIWGEADGGEGKKLDKLLVARLRKALYTQ